MGSLTSPKSARHHVSATCSTDLPMLRPTRLPRHNHRPGSATLLRHPIACLLPARIPTSPQSVRRPPTVRVVSTTRFSMGGPSRVREYQPVVPTYPGRISLALEPLVIRRQGFSPCFRYSCLHSHSCSVHGWITPPLHSLHDAPLPIHTRCECHSFGGVLEPRYIVGAEPLDQ
jgi:hypothetical protein